MARGKRCSLFALAKPQTFLELDLGLRPSTVVGTLLALFRSLKKVTRLRGRDTRSSRAVSAALVTRSVLVWCAVTLVPWCAAAQPAAPANPPEKANSAADRSAERRASKLVEIGLEAALERAQSAYQAGRYDACAKGYGEILAHLDELRAEVAPSTLEQARVYHAACLLAIGDMPAADQQLRSALGDNPLMASPDPVIFPDQVRDLFFKVKADFLDEIQRAQDAKLELARQEANKRLEQARQERLRVERLEAAARTETLVHKNYRWVAFVPFGVGQFQNGDDLWGGLLLSSEVLALGAAVTGVALELHAHSEADGGTRVKAEWAEERFNEPIAIYRQMGVLASGSFLFLAVVGVLEANINFVPERPAGSRLRELPKNLRPVTDVSVVPTASATQSSVHLGLSGTF